MTILHLKHFERTKTAYRVLDDFVAHGFATSRRVNSTTYYFITSAGQEEAKDVLEGFRQTMEIPEAEEEETETPLRDVYIPETPEALYETVRSVDTGQALTSPDRLTKLYGNLKRIVDGVRITPDDVKLFAEEPHGEYANFF